MKELWRDDHRELVENLVKFSNSYVQTYNRPLAITEQISLTAAEVQTVEYLLENEEKNEKMVQIASRLGVSPSTLTQNVKKMVRLGLLEKYHSETNKKDVIVRVSHLGRQIYELYTHWATEQQFSPFFAMLGDMPPESVRTLSRALAFLSRPDEVQDSPTPAMPRLVRIE